MIQIVQILCSGIATTVIITAGSFAVGAVVGVPLVLARTSRFKALSFAGGSFIELLRSVPPIVWLFLLYYGVTVGGHQFGTKTAAIVGLGLIASAYMAEIYRAALQSVPAGQWEVARALGLSPVKMYSKVVAPQGLLLAIPPAATYAIGLLKDSAVASVIGANDVTFQAFQHARVSNDGLTTFIIAAGLYLLLSLPVAALARFSGSFLESRLAS